MHTLVYGLFVVRYYDSSPENFSRQEARDLVPASNPFLCQFFDHRKIPEYLLPLTSNLDNKTTDDIFIKADDSNRLKFGSIIKVYSIISFDRSRFINKIGKANNKTLIIVRQYLKKHFDF